MGRHCGYSVGDRNCSLMELLGKESTAFEKMFPIEGQAWWCKHVGLALGGGSKSIRNSRSLLYLYSV